MVYFCFSRALYFHRNRPYRLFFISVVEHVLARGIFFNRELGSYGLVLIIWSKLISLDSWGCAPGLWKVKVGIVFLNWFDILLAFSNQSRFDGPFRFSQMASTLLLNQRFPGKSRRIFLQSIVLVHEFFIYMIHIQTRYYLKNQFIQLSYQLEVHTYVKVTFPCRRDLSNTTYLEKLFL